MTDALRAVARQPEVSSLSEDRAPSGHSESGDDRPVQDRRCPIRSLTDLKQRLARTRFPGEIAGSNWDYGTNLPYLKELVTYWRDTFDWRAAERRLNQFDQFTTNIDGLDIHFIHQRSKNPNAMPTRGHSRLAGLGRRVHEDHRSAHRPGRARRQCRAMRSTSWRFRFRGSAFQESRPNAGTVRSASPASSRH